MIGSDMRALRKRLGVHQDDLARRLNLDKRTISNIETDRVSITKEAAADWQQAIQELGKEKASGNAIKSA